MIKLILYI